MIALPPIASQFSSGLIFLERIMLSFFDVVLAAIDQKSSRQKIFADSVDVDLQEEIGELQIELARENHQVLPGIDGVRGEAHDVMAMLIHTNKIRDSDYSERAAVDEVVPKLEKWLGEKLEFPPPPPASAAGLQWQAGPAIRDGVEFANYENYLIARRAVCGDPYSGWVIEIACANYFPDEVNGSVCKFESRDAAGILSGEVCWFISFGSLVESLRLLP